jgi:putative N-acetylmannosamine-6-phosphate epimerase/predicted NBD/HSP70 family sugar kinase
MTVAAFVDLLAQCPLIASVQAAEGSPLAEAQTLTRMAEASGRQGVKVLRMQGVANIAAARSLGLPIIGLIKRDYADSEVYITASLREVEELAGCEVIALDGTRRPRPQPLSALIARAHELGALVLADIDSVDSARYAVECGADLLSTTLAGYTPHRAATQGPDLELLREVVSAAKVPVLAEGRIEEPWQVEAALRIGASGVVIGGALNDPEKNTRRFLPAQTVRGKVGAVDIGGTWLRFGVFSCDWELLESERIANPPGREERLDWIRGHLRESGVERVGVSTGGIVDPSTGEVWTAKEYLMPDHVGIRFDEATLGVPAYAHGDGHATAWGHACLPQFAGRRVATLALGTGVGCGFVREGRIWSGRRGEYPRVNDLPAPGGLTYEELLGGFHIGRQPSGSEIAAARSAFEGAAYVLKNLYFPDDLIIGGSVGLCEWMLPQVEAAAAVPSPFGADAGLYGAAALALFPSYR